eukprot:Phypoly_transcript_16562.p1 GENE.Phypoly_transcript_16562~~Phypoly_transcript_16562.p1  ORF type:complete len:157 (+),score=30.29 Phypoly_transcript_16562:380-850(+)
MEEEILRKLEMRKSWWNNIGNLAMEMVAKELYEWPLSAIKEAWNACKNDKQREDLKNDILESLKEAQQQSGFDDGSTWQSHINHMIYRDYYGATMEQWPEGGYNRQMDSFTIRRHQLEFQKWVQSHGKKVDLPAHNLPMLLPEVADFLKVSTGSNS